MFLSVGVPVGLYFQFHGGLEILAIALLCLRFLPFIASKPKSNILELGTGISFSLAWMANGLDAHSKLTGTDNHPHLTEIANRFFGQDNRVDLVCADGAQRLKNYTGSKFDLIFAEHGRANTASSMKPWRLLKLGEFTLLMI